jgi:EmrB/QacA subfamily drug resistance transporter
VSDDALNSQQKLTLAACGVAVALVTIDFTAIDVVITPIEKDLDSDLSTIQWVVNGYFLSFAALLVTGGRLADIFGRRRILLLGIAIFGAMSLLGGLAATDWWLIAARALQGAGGALIYPAAMGIAFAVAPPSRKAFAMGLIIGAAGFGTAIGPALGGLLSELASWRLVLLFNIPVAALAAAATLRNVEKDSGEEGAHHLDYGGIALFGGALALLLLAIDQSSAWGWGDERTIGLLVLAAALAVALAFVESRVDQPLLPRDVIRNRRFVIPALVGGAMGGPLFIVLFYVPQFLEKLKGWTTLAAGAGSLPLTVALAVSALFAGGLYARLGAKAMVAGASLVIGAGALIIALVDETTSYAVLVPGLVLMGVGLGFGLSSANTAAVGSVDPSRTSVASGLTYMTRTMLSTIALAVATTIYIGVGESRLDENLAAADVSISSEKQAQLEGLLAGTDSAQEVLDELPAAAADRVSPAVSDAFLSGLHDVMFLGAGLAAAGALVALLFVGGRVEWPHRLRHSTELTGGPSPPTVEYHEAQAQGPSRETH